MSKSVTEIADQLADAARCVGVSVPELRALIASLTDQGPEVPLTGSAVRFLANRIGSLAMSGVDLAAVASAL